MDGQSLDRTEGTVTEGTVYEPLRHLWASAPEVPDLLSAGGGRRIVLRQAFVVDEISIPSAGKATDRTAARTRRFTITTERTDRQGDIIRAAGVQIDMFMRNPVVLFAHQARMPPIGTATAIIPRKRSIDADVDFFSADVYPFADTIFRIIEAGGLRAASIGFIPVSWERIAGKEEGTTIGFDFKESELLEFSIVPIPANPDALARIKGEGVNLTPYLDWLEKAAATHFSDLLPPEFRPTDSRVLDLCRAAGGSTRTIVVGSSVGSSGNPAVDGEWSAKEDVADEEPLPESGVEVVGRAVISFAAAHPDGTPAEARDAAWDVAAEVKAATVDDLLVMSAWRKDKPRADLVKGDFKFPHHKAARPWRVNFRALAAGIAVLNGGRGGANIPDGDRRGVYNHLAKHVRDDFEAEPPDLKWLEHFVLRDYPELFVFDFQTAQLLFRYREGFLLDIRHLPDDAIGGDGRLDLQAFETVAVADDVLKQAFVIQSVLGRKRRWPSRDAFLQWAKDHDFRTDKVDETRQFWRLRQKDPEGFERLRTICILPNDISAGSESCRVAVVGGPEKQIVNDVHDANETAVDVGTEEGGADGESPPSPAESAASAVVEGQGAEPGAVVVGGSVGEAPKPDPVSVAGRAGSVAASEGLLRELVDNGLLRQLVKEIISDQIRQQVRAELRRVTGELD